MLASKVNFCSWNIHGYYSRDIGNKLKDKDFLRTIHNVDFIGISETHIHDEVIDDLSIPGFQCLSFKNRKKNLRSNTGSGGIAVFIKDHVHVPSWVRVLKWVLLLKEIFSLNTFDLSL